MYTAVLVALLSHAACSKSSGGSAMATTETAARLAASLATSSAYAWLNYGVALEKLGNKEGAAEAYNFSLKRNPGLADAHYNLAILYWNRDWEKVRFELAETVRLNPNHPQAARYLEQLQNKK